MSFQKMTCDPQTQALSSMQTIRQITCRNMTVFELRMSSNSPHFPLHCHVSIMQ